MLTSPVRVPPRWLRGFAPPDRRAPSGSPLATRSPSAHQQHCPREHRRASWEGWSSHLVQVVLVAIYHRRRYVETTSLRSGQFVLRLQGYKESTTRYHLTPSPRHRWMTRSKGRTNDDDDTVWR